MTGLVGDIKGVAVYLDDILITGPNAAEHVATVRKVLDRLRGAGLRIKKEKCSLMQPRITYLGHTIDKSGIHPTEDKVRAIHEAPEPRDVSELRSFLGILNYYSKFMPNLSAQISPLYNPTKKDTV